MFETGYVTEVACWAHVRRKFFDERAANQSPIRTEALDRIGALYGIENTIRWLPTDERRRIRREKAASLLAALRAWLDATLPKLSAKSDLAKAMCYILIKMWAGTAPKLRN